MNEADIKHENGAYWVLRDKKSSLYLVMKSELTHSVGVDGVGYPMNEDGLSIAIARCDYLASKQLGK